MKLAHLVLAHNNPAQLLRLVKSLSHPDADVYIHLDSKVDISDYQDIQNTPNTFFIKNRVKVFWCEYSTIQATINAMEEILATGVVYSHINLLSGNDYPLQSAASIHDFLFANTGKTFMWFDDIFNSWPEGRARINKYYFGDYGFPGRFQLATLVNSILPSRKMPLNLIAYGRAQWLTITPKLAKYTVEYIHAHPQLKSFFRKTFAIDEVFFQTILCNSPYRDELVNDNLRHIVLNAEYRPVTLTMADAPTLSACGKFYARKFDMATDTQVLDYLDNTITHEENFN